MSYVVRNTSSSDSDKPPIYVNIVGYNSDTNILATNAAGMYKYTTTYTPGSKGYLRQTSDTIYYLTEDPKLTIVNGQNTINYGNYLDDCFQRSSDTISATPFKLDVMLSTGDTPANCIRLYTSDSAATPPSSCQPDPKKDSPCSPLPPNCIDGNDCCKALGAQSQCGIDGFCSLPNDQNSQSLLKPSELQSVKCDTSPSSPCDLSGTTISPCSLGSCENKLARGKKCELECPHGETGNSYISCGSGGGISVNCDCSPGSGKKKKPHSKPNGKKKKPLVYPSYK